MKALEIHLNGKKLCTAGLEEGMLVFSVSCSGNKPGTRTIGLGLTGVTATQQTVRWQQRILRISDQVQIKIVETTTVDEPEVLQIAPRDSRKYEKAYIRRMAKQFGWTIQTGARKTG